MVMSSTLLFPALPLLLVPIRHTRCLFGWWAGVVQGSFLSVAIGLVHHVMGVDIIIYTHSKEELAEMCKLGDTLIISNHRTRVDWIFLWALALALRRLNCLKIILKSMMRQLPGFGWAMQCFGYAFLSRSDRASDVSTICGAIELGCKDWLGGKLAFLLFPEGTDLSESNLAKSRERSETLGLRVFSQVLHPRTAGFANAWRSLMEHSSSPALLDVTIGYTDYKPGEILNESGLFVTGRACRQVHIFVERVANPTVEDCDELCKSLFHKKEDRLCRFYAPCEEGKAPDVAAMGFETAVSFTKTPGWKRSIVAGSVVSSLAHITAYYMVRRTGFRVSTSALVLTTGFFIFLGKMNTGIDRLIFRHAGIGSDDGKTKTS